MKTPIFSSFINTKSCCDKETRFGNYFQTILHPSANVFVALNDDFKGGQRSSQCWESKRPAGLALRLGTLSKTWSRWCYQEYFWDASPNFRTNLLTLHWVYRNVIFSKLIMCSCYFITNSWFILLGPLRATFSQKVSEKFLMEKSATPP